MDRREFLKGTAWMSLAAAAAGCSVTKMNFGAGAPMAGFAAPALKEIKIAFVGVGSRGSYALRRICQFPGVKVVAICDPNPKAVAACQKYLKDKKLPPAKEYGGQEGYKKACQESGCNVVYACTPWKLHAPVALYAMNTGKHAFIEVPATMDVDGCWELVETSERTKCHCMMLENACYGEEELLCLNMCRLGLLGEAVYGGAGYLHYSLNRLIKGGPTWRNEYYQEHVGNTYPTHGLGPVAQYMDINRGDAFDYLVSVETGSFGPPAMAKALFKDPNCWQRQVKLASGDANLSIIRTKMGKAIYLSLCMPDPHPYSRINLYQGTKGIFMGYPLRIAFEEQFCDDKVPHKAFDDKKTAEYRELYRHPLWKDVGMLAKKIGGHGGCDFLMDLRWVYCLQNGLPLDQDVYDLAAWSCICEVSEKSVRNRSQAVDIPDFTRGAWRTNKPLVVGSVDIAKMGFKDSASGGKQQDI